MKKEPKNFFRLPEEPLLFQEDIFWIMPVMLNLFLEQIRKRKLEKKTKQMNYGPNAKDTVWTDERVLAQR